MCTVTYSHEVRALYISCACYFEFTLKVYFLQRTVVLFGPVVYTSHAFMYYPFVDNYF